MDYSEYNIKFKDFDTVCRFCLTSEALLNPIFLGENDDAFNYKNENETVADLIEKCTRIEICPTDFLPKLICSECMDQLMKFNNFRRQCLKSDEILKNIAKNCRNDEMASELHSKQCDSMLDIFIKMEEDVNETVNGSYSADPLLIGNKSDDSELEYNVRNSNSPVQKRKYVKRVSGQTPQRRKRKKLALCCVCGKMMENLTVHLQTHSSVEKKHKCNKCDKVFNDKRYLEVHAVCHTGERKFVCDICNETYKFAHSLLRHRRSHSQDRRYKCNTCHKSFYTKPCLTKHVRCHTGERPYKCELCEKGFASSSHLTRHKRTHTKKGSFKCFICEGTFIRKKDLVEHMENHKTKTEIE